MAPVDDHLRAAPPDDGGHHGSYTLPEETMAVSGGEGPEPALSRDTTAARSPWRLTWGVAALAAVVVLLSMLLAVPYLP